MTPRPGGRAAHRAYLPASARRLPAGGAETWPAGETCEEPRVCPERTGTPLPEPATGIGDWQAGPFPPTDYLPSSQRASGGRPHLVIWHFQLPAG